uniref:Nucleoprotein TPR n=1 Tax=Mastacembelus armatus TaxID=205130 RepID=A0A7N9ASS5_9TELE
MAAVLSQVLERTELSKLPKVVQNKLEKFVTELQSANEALRAQHERFKADSEQQYFDIEKRLVESQEQILSATKDLQALKEENKKLSECTISKPFLDENLCVWLQQTKTKYEIEAEKRELARLLEKRTQEVENLTEDVKRLNERLAETCKVKMELQLKLDDIQSSDASVQHREKRLEQEKELLEKKIEWLSAELKTKTDELLSTNRDKGKEILELQGSLKNILIMMCVVDVTLFVANKVLEKKVSEGEELKAQLEAELSEKIKKMDKELENATRKAAGAPSLTEEQLDYMCPSAAAIAAIVQPGMKFFDLYNAYAECQTQLHLEKQETRRLSRVLDEIVQEVESKAPLLKRQREEYESMQRSMSSLCNKLEQARTVWDNILQKEKEEAKQHYDAIERDKLRTEKQLEDTSAQVCALLVELEEARGNQVTKDDSGSADISSTTEVTSPRQLSFRSVEELQRQNQSLLGKLRELEEEKDRQQKLETSVNKLQKEVDELGVQRNQQKQLADSTARQRDMYKALLTQSTGFSLPLQGPDESPQPAHVCPSVPSIRSSPQRPAAAESTHTAQAKVALKQLNDAFTLYKKEKAENDRMLNETNDMLQRQLTELRSSHAKLTSQLEFSNKRYEMLQETILAYRREISALQNRNQKMSATAQQHEHIIHTISQDLRQANEKLALDEVRIENLTKERDILRQAESRFNREREAMLAEQRNQNLLLTNLKAIQLSMEHIETETRQRLNNKIEQLELELASVKTRLDQEVAQRHALGRTMDAQLLEAKKQLETQNTLQKKTRELLRSSEQQVATLKAQLASKQDLKTAPQQPSQLEQELAEVKGLLRTAEEQNSELAEQLKNANSTVEQYRAVVLTLEDSLKKEKESRSPLEIRLKESADMQQQLEKRILETEKMRQQEQEERRKAVEELDKQVGLSMHRYTNDLQFASTKLAGEAQAKYERELMLHAADVEALQELKKRCQQDLAQKRELEEHLSKSSSLLQERTAAWSALEQQLKEDLSNHRHRCEELGKQNALLHQQMDEMSVRSRQQQQQQQQLDLSFSEEGKTTEQILEILRFVRREKQIAVAQCEASEGEALRYKQRVAHQDRELKELQEALNSEREKMQATVKTLAQQEEQLKKIETISALQETNKMLKMDRDKLEHELQEAQAKVTKLQSDISPLHHSLSQLSERNGSLQADKRILEEDLKRWRAKAQQLLSQQKDGDMEEKQKLTSEREVQQRRITQLAEETAKLKTELARSNASSNSAQSQLQALRDSVARLTSERDNLKKELETKTNDILEKNKTITQVKKIGRRYKTQYEELKAQQDKVGLWLQQSQQTSQQSHNEEISSLKTALSQAESTVRTNLLFYCDEVLHRNSFLSVRRLQIISTGLKGTMFNPLGSEGLTESKNREEQLKQQMADKEEKTKKAFLGAKTKISQLNSAKEQLSLEIEEMKQSKEELEVRMNALKSQYEGRLLRLDRELKELRDTQTHADSRDEPQDQSGTKAGDQLKPADQRQISLKSPAQDRGSSSVSEPPTANIRPTPSTPSPSNKPIPSPGSKATPRASIRPMVTPATVPIPTPTATVMPTTQTESQEVLISAGASVHSTSSSLVNAPTSITQPSSTQATAFVQPTQQQAASQDVGSSMEAERPSTSSSLIGTGVQDHVLHPAVSNVLNTEWGKMNWPVELPEEGFPALPEDDEDIEEEGVSQSVPSDQMSSQGSIIIRDVIVIDTDSESRESKEEVEEEEEENDEDDAGHSGMRGGEESNEGSSEAEEEPSQTSNTEENTCGMSSDGQRPSELSHSSENSSSATSVSDPSRDTSHLPTTSSSSVPSPCSSITPRLPHPNRPAHSLPPRLYIQPPAPELGPPHTQVCAHKLVSIYCMFYTLQQHFFDDDDRMVPSTPTLVVPHRTDGFAEAIHSPQVAGLSTRFRFGPPEDLLPQTSASHSDLGQLASQGGLGMYESPLFLAAHDEDGGGRSVPTTPLQVAAPGKTHSHIIVSVLNINAPSCSLTLGLCQAGVESSLESQADMDSTGQQSDEPSLPSTSQDPGMYQKLLYEKKACNHELGLTYKTFKKCLQVYNFPDLNAEI